MKEFLNFLTGNISMAMFCALFFFALIGASINLLLNASKRYQASPNTPKEFSLKFMLWDNWKRILLSVLLIYISIRFVSVLYEIQVTDNNELYLFIAVIIGFLYDKLGEILKNRSIILKVRKE